MSNIDGIKSVRLEIELKNKDITRILMQPRRISFVLNKYFEVEICFQ